MTQYINKDTLVAEIERLKVEALQKKSQCKRSGLEKIMHQIGTYNKILSLIDTLEVKEGDLEKEIQSWVEHNSVNGYYREDVYETAEHFFELGLNIRKED